MLRFLDNAALQLNTTAICGLIELQRFLDRQYKRRTPYHKRPYLTSNLKLFFGFQQFQIKEIDMRSVPEGWMDAEKEFRNRSQSKGSKANPRHKVNFVDVVLFCCVTSSLFYFML